MLWCSWARGNGGREDLGAVKMDLFNRGRVVLAASHGPEMDDRNLCSLNVLPFKNGAKEKQKGNQTSFKGFNKAARGIVKPPD